MSTPKISVGILVLNGRPFIKAQLENLYDLAHEIIICEGGTKFWHETHGFRRSNDGTLDIIHDFPDPDNKIKLIQKDWVTKNEMSKTYSKIMTGDVVYTVDIDEFLAPQHVKLMAKEMIDHNFNAVQNGHYVFFGDFETIVVNKNTPFWFRPIRMFRRISNRLINHIPIGYLVPGKGGKMTVGSPGRILQADKLGVKTHHYSYVNRENALAKFKYYAHRGWSKAPDPRLIEALERFDEDRDQMIADKFVIRRKTHDHYLAEFPGKHLPIVEDVKKDLESLLNDSQ